MDTVLPVEVLDYVFQFVPSIALGPCRLVCKQWRAVCTHERNRRLRSSPFLPTHRPAGDFVTHGSPRLLNAIWCMTCLYEDDTELECSTDVFPAACTAPRLVRHFELYTRLQREGAKVRDATGNAVGLQFRRQLCATERLCLASCFRMDPSEERALRARSPRGLPRWCLVGTPISERHAPVMVPLAMLLPAVNNTVVSVVTDGTRPWGVQRNGKLLQHNRTAEENLQRTLIHCGHQRVRCTCDTCQAFRLSTAAPADGGEHAWGASLLTKRHRGGSH